MSKKGNKNAEHDPSNDVDTNSEMITCSFQIPKGDIDNVDIVKLNAMPNWSYEEKNGSSGAQHWAKGKIRSNFEAEFDSILEDRDRVHDLCKRSYNIDLQRDERERVKQELGLVKQSARVTLNTYKAGLLEKMMSSLNLSEEEALKIINS